MGTPLISLIFYAIIYSFGRKVKQCEQIMLYNKINYTRRTEMYRIM